MDEEERSTTSQIRNMLQSASKRKQKRISNNGLCKTSETRPRVIGLSYFKVAMYAKKEISLKAKSQCALSLTHSFDVPILLSTIIFHSILWDPIHRIPALEQRPVFEQRVQE